MGLLCARADLCRGPDADSVVYLRFLVDSMAYHQKQECPKLVGSTIACPACRPYGNRDRDHFVFDSIVILRNRSQTGVSGSSALPHCWLRPGFARRRNRDITMLVAQLFHFTGPRFLVCTQRHQFLDRK